MRLRFLIKHQIRRTQYKPIIIQYKVYSTQLQNSWFQRVWWSQQPWAACKSSFLVVSLKYPYFVVHLIELVFLAYYKGLMTVIQFSLKQKDVIYGFYAGYSTRFPPSSGAAIKMRCLKRFLTVTTYFKKYMSLCRLVA